MSGEPHRAKKTKKNRKHGRNKPKAAYQAIRTEENKVKRHNYERAKAGLPPVGPLIARQQMDNCRLTS